MHGQARGDGSACVTTAFAHSVIRSALAWKVERKNSKCTSVEEFCLSSVIRVLSRRGFGSATLSQVGFSFQSVAFEWLGSTFLSDNRVFRGYLFVRVLQFLSDLMLSLLPCFPTLYPSPRALRSDDRLIAARGMRPAKPFVVAMLVTDECSIKFAIFAIAARAPCTRHEPYKARLSP